MSRGPRQKFPVRPGEERAAFLREAAVILDSESAQLDAMSDLSERYGVDELEVFELVQRAEDVWGVRLNPDPMSEADIATMMGRFPTLEEMMMAAEAAAQRTLA